MSPYPPLSPSHVRTVVRVFREPRWSVSGRLSGVLTRWAQIGLGSPRASALSADLPALPTDARPAARPLGAAQMRQRLDTHKQVGLSGKHENWRSRSVSAQKNEPRYVREKASGRKARQPAIFGSRIRPHKRGSSFVHLPLGVVQIADNVKVDERAAEISNKMFTMFKELQTQKAGLVRMVSVLTAVKRKGNALNLEEDDGDDY
ncbi:hypothetical protein GGX14DRAFT_396755 [Mycena pura]|uniref:Uncharacterized protein n=1 Tax=Mycena pura TaxID=153505 RepID=A0AAD6YFA8_9AGAR|nr:hypothetical protein GGX14DRAFT_396755 [Mycena pura]